MRERLTVAFIAITLLLLLGAGLVRSYAGDADVRDIERDAATATAVGLAVVLSVERSSGGGIDEADLEPFLRERLELTYAAEGVPDVVVTGAEHEGPQRELIIVTASVDGGGTVTVSRQHDESLEGIWDSNVTGMVALFVLLAMIAGTLGYLVARHLSGPFRQLAVAAAALGRGRFDLDLPRGGVPEARAIASALDSSAGQLKERLENERAFSQHASHVLRTPLTSLSFRLEELVEDPALSDESRAEARACLEAVAVLNRAAGELVELGGRGPLVARAAIPLRDLAAQVAQRWADKLDADDRRVSAAVEGDLDLSLTPGPVEQILDLMLDAVVRHESGLVRLVFEGGPSRLRIDVLCESEGSMGAPCHPVSDEVRAVLDALGGRLEQPNDVDVLRLHLPRR